MIRRRRLGFAALVVGLLVIALAQRISPVAAPPLYDGVVVVDAYVWLVPPPGAKGNPQSASATLRPDHGTTPLIAIATPEQPPQAQIFATTGALVLPPGTTSIKVSITAILPQALPTDGHIAGNVYRISVVNQAGVPLTAPESAKVSAVLRGPDGTAGATIERYTNPGWQPLKTDDAGFGSTYLAVVTQFGDFALVAPGPGGPYPTASPAPGASVNPSSSTGVSDAPDGSIAAVSPPRSAPAASGQPVPVGPPADNGGGAPLAAVSGLLVVVVIGASATLLVRRRRRRALYRGAHPRQ